MVLKSILFYKQLAIIIFLITLFGCADKSIQTIKKSELKSKLEQAFNNSAESWWYAGTDKKFHYIVIKKPLISDTIKVSTTDLNIINIKNYDYTENSSNWVNLKVENIKFKSANK